MPRFFITSEQVDRGRVVLDSAAGAHLSRSLRVRPGESVVVVEAGTREHGVVVDGVTRDRVTGSIVWTRSATGEPRLRVHVLQAIAAQDMDAAVAALAQAGVDAIWPVLTSRGVVRPPAGRAAERAGRWRAIAREASQLAGRARAPEVHEVGPLAAALTALPRECRILACVLDPAAAPLGALALNADVTTAVVIGPEGGLDDAERRSLHEFGAREVHLGPRVIPARLAGFLAVSLLLGRAGDLDVPVAPPDGPR